MTAIATWRRVMPWLALAAAVILADQWSKAAIQQALRPGEVREIAGCFDLVLAYNRGAAFSFLSSAGRWQGYLFLAVAAAASVVIVRLLARAGHTRLMSLGLALILGGALGNAVDRVHYGHVVDFIDFHWSWLAPLFTAGHFPAFNLADSAITAGVIALLLDELLKMRRMAA